VDAYQLRQYGHSAERSVLSKHVVETKGNTLLPHYLGLYRLTVEDKENYMIVMRNVTTSKYKVHAKYDIKGSTVDRAAKQKEKSKDSPTLKDNDLISEGRCIHIGKQSKKEFIDKLNADVNVGVVVENRFLARTFGKKTHFFYLPIP
jgi:hypothetical protein